MVQLLYYLCGSLGVAAATFPKLVAGDALSDALALMDLDNSSGVSLTEFDSYKAAVIDDPEARATCQDSKLSFTSAGIALNDEATSLPQISSLLLTVLDCVQSLICAERLHVQVNDQEHVCYQSETSVAAHEDHDDGKHNHDEEEDAHHDHHHHGTEAEVNMDVGLTNITCDFVKYIDEEPALHVSATGQQWLEALAAVSLVCLASLIGIVSIFFGCGSLVSDDPSTLALAMDLTSLGVGILLGAVLLHIIPEAGLLSGGLDWKVGLCIVSGIVTALVVEIGSHHRSGHEPDVLGGIDLSHFAPAHASKLESAGTGSESENSLAQGGDAETQQQDAGLEQALTSDEKPSSTRLTGRTMNIIWGDAFHNFSDGVLISITFLLCNSSLGWLVTLSVLCHELPQEYIDFIIITRDGVPARKALLFNLLSSATAIVGAVLGLSLGPFLSPLAQGLIIAYGSGVLIYIALVELTPTAFMAHKIPTSRKLKRLVLLIIGTAVIGALQLFHPECEEAHGH